MMTPEDKESLLERYVTGQPVSPEEEIRFDELLKSDPDFRADYRARQALFDAGKRARRIAWEARPAGSVSPVERAFFPMRWVAAASIILALGLGITWWTRQTDDKQVLSTGTAQLFEQRDGQLGLAGNDTSAVGTVVWVVTRAATNQYEFSQLDTLRIYATNPEQWQESSWRLTSLSEVRYKLQVADRIYLLDQGRTIRLPLEPAN